MLPMLAGANMIYGPGMLESGMTMDLGQLVSDADFVRMMKTVLNGVEITDESLAVDLIKEVGIKGEYLSEIHTFNNFKNLQSNPLVMDRNTRNKWKGLGGKDMAVRSNEKAKQILAKHHPKPLTDEVALKVRGIVQRAEKELIERKSKNQ